MGTSGHPRKRRFFVAAIAAAAALALSACSGGGASAPKAEPKDSGKEVDTVKVAFPGSLANLYIGQESGILNYYLAGNVQEGLTAIDAEGKIVPALASQWETPDDKTYVFTLRDDAKFQNGDPVTPEDVVFSLEKAKDATASPSTTFYLQSMASAKATGAHEVTITTSAPDAAFLTTVSNVGALVVTEKSFWEKHQGKVGTSSALLMGSGPYKVTEFKPDSGVTLERVDTWWGTKPKVKKIEIDFIPDENTRLLAAQKGDVDVAFNVPIKQAKQWEKISGARVEAVNDLSFVGLLFDQKVAPFDDPKVREAISMSVDRKAIVEKLLRGYGEVATSIMTPESLSQTANADEARKQLAAIPQHDFDVAKAKELLKGTKAESGLSLELTYPNTGPQLGTAAQSLSENLKKIGIEVKVREVPIEEWLATIGDGKHGLSFMWYFSTTGDPAEVNGYLLGEGNPSHIEDPAAKQLIADAGAATDPKKRAEILIELEKLNAKNTYVAPLWWGQTVTFFDKKVGVHNFSPYTFLGPWGAQLYSAE